MPVEINIEDALWSGLSPAPEPVVEAAALATLTHLAIPPEGWLVNVLLCDDAKIRELNQGFRGKDKPTNVLSWPAWDLAPDTPGGEPEDPGLGDPEEPEELGDIAIARQTMQREAEEQGKPFAHHLGHLTVHSVLHLLGYDHETEADALLMESIERVILAGMGIPDPYA